MAQKIQVLLIDDLDSTRAEGAVRFGLDGTEYEIDLNAEQAGRCGRRWRAISVPPGGPGAAPGAQSVVDAGRRAAD